MEISDTEENALKVVRWEAECNCRLSWPIGYCIGEPPIKGLGPESEDPDLMKNCFRRENEETKICNCKNLFCWILQVY